tara:strand:+ start:189 stop:641 length:453 start_codon:yes stop_codon:yes gene_type:complete
MKPKKKFSETKLGQFLKKVGSSLVNNAEHILPDNGFYGVIKNLITVDKQLTPEDKITALKLLEIDMVEMQEVSKRWESDMKSDSWLSKNTRPMTLIFLTISTVFIIILDSLNIDFGVNVEWIELLKSLLITTYVAYFGSRGVEKFKAISK